LNDQIYRNCKRNTNCTVKCRNRLSHSN